MSKNFVSYDNAEDLINGINSKKANKPLILTGTLTAGNTTLTISNASITTDMMVDVYTSVYGVSPTNVVVAAGSITLTFEAQSSDIDVKVKLTT